MPIIFGIDGTDGWAINTAGRNRSYDANFANSFVRRIASGRGNNTRYERGPLVHGGNLDNSVMAGVQFIKQRRAAEPSQPILLTGYSRGAAGVIQVAKLLDRERNPPNIAAIMLFDCVDRHISFNTDTIPNNVSSVLHVMRDPSAASREGFGNSGLRHFPATDYEPLKKFKCTHGGMGGCPWIPDQSKGQKPTDMIDEGMGVPRIVGVVPTPMGAQPQWAGDGKTRVTFQEDALVSAQVWEFCQPYLKRKGFL